MFGLLGLLLTIGIVAFLAVQVLDGVGGSSSPPVDVDATDAGSGPATTVASGAPSGAGSPTDAAQAASCTVERDTVQTAAEAFRVVHGSYPPDVRTLVDAGYLTELPAGTELHVEGDTLVLRSAGPCAAG